MSTFLCSRNNLSIAATQDIAYFKTLSWWILSDDEIVWPRLDPSADTDKRYDNRALVGALLLIIVLDGTVIMTMIMRRSRKSERVK